jgi:hypothetical protein
MEMVKRAGICDGPECDSKTMIVVITTGFIIRKQ